MQNEYEYFSRMWSGETDGPAKAAARNTSNLWNERADDWAMLLSTDTPFKRSLDARVASAAEFLRERGALKNGYSVIDIGCGPGRFVAEFAKTAAHASGTDISEKMVNHSAAYAESAGLKNTSFTACDFKAAQPSDMGWSKAFDLVFASITPAVGDMDGLRKMIEMSRAYCFNSSFVWNTDDLRDRISRNVFGAEPEENEQLDGRGFYSLFNLLWLDGYFPEVRYHNQELYEDTPVDDELIRYYTRVFSKRGIDRAEVYERIGAYLARLCRADGTVQTHSSRRYGWTLWDVRERGPRRVGIGDA